MTESSVGEQVASKKSVQPAASGDGLTGEAGGRPVAGFAEYLGMIRFSHTIFAMPFALLAMVWAVVLPLPGGGAVSLRAQDVIGVLLCMVLARSAAMAFNRIVDHRIDAENPRTASRHIPAGVISRRSAIAFTIACSIGFLAATLLFLPNQLPVIAAPVVLAFLCGYSLAKRFTASAHLWLGVALSLSPVCVWAAVRGGETVSIASDWMIPSLLAGTVALWVAGFDIIYACQDADFDRDSGLHSVPGRYGVSGALRIAALLHGAMLLVLVALAMWGSDLGLGTLFGLGVAATAALIIMQHRLVRPDDLTRVNAAFFHTNAIVSLVLLVAGVIDCYV